MYANSLKLAALAALALTAACAKKPPAQLPLAPGQDSTAGTDTGQTAGVIRPGSREDFINSVPSDRIFFDTDTYNVDEQDRQILDAQATWLQRYPNVRVTLEGHADERGTREYNLALGDRRANAAKNYLQSRGIGAERMNVISWGKERPVATGSDETSWAQNRRAVTVVPE
jgi:peptidoglycan-associated lipoprotein